MNYKDRTFCDSDCINTHCFRNFSDDERRGARMWWGHDPDNAPIAMADFSKDCEAYIK